MVDPVPACGRRAVLDATGQFGCSVGSRAVLSGVSLVLDQVEVLIELARSHSGELVDASLESLFRLAVVIDDAVNVDEEGGHGGVGLE